MSGILNESIIVREPDTDEIEYLLDKQNKGCKKKRFHTIRYRCVNEIELTNITSKEKVFRIIAMIV